VNYYSSYFFPSYRIILFSGRHYLSELIEWNKIGYELIGTAENGKEALEFISRNSVDVILSDIRMPVMDGLTLANYIRSEYNHIKIILMTAYREFEFARESVKLGITDYLLKSDEEDIIEKCFTDLKKELDAKKSVGIDSCQEDDALEKGAVHPVICKCLSLIEKNFGNISLSDLAWHTHVHEKHLSRLFKKELGKSFSSIQFEKRIAAAKIYLKRSDLRVFEIAQIVGYSSSAYFSDKFKKRVGFSPLEYRNR